MKTALCKKWTLGGAHGIGPSYGKPPQKAPEGPCKALVFPCTSTWALTVTPWLRCIFNWPFTQSSKHRFRSWYWGSFEWQNRSSVKLNWSFPRVILGGIYCSQPVRSSSCMGAPCSCCNFVFLLFQKLVSRSTLRRQGKESSKEGNGIGVNSSSRLGINNFEFIRVLGKGSFGKVSLGFNCLGWSKHALYARTHPHIHFTCAILSSPCVHTP